MERAIRAYKMQTRYLSSRLASEELHNDIIPNFISGRTKRDVQTATKHDSKKEKTTKNKKTKREKVHRKVTVTKYTINGDVYALRVKETAGAVEDNQPLGTSCLMYSVKKSFPCDSPEGYLLATENTKINKKTKKTAEKIKTVPQPTTEKAQPRLSYRKRQVDNTQIPENVMPSIEEFERE